MDDVEDKGNVEEDDYSVVFDDEEEDDVDNKDVINDIDSENKFDVDVTLFGVMDEKDNIDVYVTFAGVVDDDPNNVNPNDIEEWRIVNYQCNDKTIELYRTHMLSMVSKYERSRL